MFRRGMMEEEYIDVHKIREHYSRLIERFRSDSRISEHNRKLVLDFVRDAAMGKTVIGRAKKRLGQSRLINHINHLWQLCYYLKEDLDKLRQEDMERFIEALETGGIRVRIPARKAEQQQLFGRAISESYRFQIKSSIRRFYTWLWGDSRTVPDIVAWFDMYVEKKDVPALTESEVQALVDRATTTKQRAIIQVLFDGGFRIGELLNVRLRHVRFVAVDPNAPDKSCFLVRVPFSKTLRRTVILPMEETTKWLKHWLDDHPAKPSIQADGTLGAVDTAAQLFPISVHTVQSMLSRLGRTALRKRVYPHLLRHTSATFWANRLSHFKLCKRFGWIMTSPMPQRYIDRAGVDELEVAEIYFREQTRRQERRPQAMDGMEILDHVREEDGQERYRL